MEAVSARDVERYHAAALEMADEARRIVGPALERGLHVETKPDRSLVTDVDRAVERRCRELIERWFPDHGVLGEEYPPTRSGSAFQWIMDPIDGTEEFVHGIPTYGFMLALHHGDVPLVGVIDHPTLDIRVHAGRGLGTRRPFRYVPRPTAAFTRMSSAGWSMTPTSGTSRRWRASIVPNVGMPWTNSSVPSIGSMIHWNALSGRAAGYSSPSAP